MKASKVRRRSAFTLTEVVIAIGIFAVAIIGILSLMATALDNARLSATDTVLAAMAQEITTELRSQAFSNVFATVGSGIAVTNYFLEDGTRTTNAAEALYVCLVNGTGNSSDGSYSNTVLITGTLGFSWPVPAPLANRTQVTIPFKLARYEP